MGDAWRRYLLHVAVEIDEDYAEIQGTNMRKERKHLRDRNNPFEMKENHFIGMFRLSRDLVRQLCEDLKERLERKKRNGLRTEIKVLAALHFYAAGSYQLSVGQNFVMCMSQSSVSRCVTQVSSCINEILLERYVKFPLAPRDITNARQRFMTKYHFPGVVGILDCTHVAIVPPAVNDPDLPEHMFVNRKGYHSINVQLICNADLTILNVNARYGGATHDAFIWANSRAMVEMREMHTRNGHTSWLLGDSGYPLQPWLLTPVVGAAPGTPEYLYTSRHVATRSCIERCNGVLKSRFRCLRKDRVLHYKPTKAASIINACAVLHNLAIAAGLPEPECEDEQVAEMGLDFNVNEFPGEPNVLREGRRIRNVLIRNHFT